MIADNAANPATDGTFSRDSATAPSVSTYESHRMTLDDAWWRIILEPRGEFAETTSAQGAAGIARAVIPV